jgi:hypothetical protein
MFEIWGFHSSVVEDLHLLRYDIVLLGECFYSIVVEDSGVLGCEAVLQVSASTVVLLRIQVFWDVMLHCWVFLQQCSSAFRCSGMWCCLAGCFYCCVVEEAGLLGCDAVWVLLQWYSWGFRSSGMWCCNAACFYSGVVEDSGLLGCDATLLGECFYSKVVEDSGVLECDAMLQDECVSKHL